MPDTGYEVARWTVTGAAVAGNTTNTYEHTVSAAAMVNVSLKKRPTKLRLNRTGEHLNRLNRVCYIKIRYFQSERW